jgi:TetR/AcrR family transcriptional regulator
MLFCISFQKKCMNTIKDISTEEHIKAVARAVFIEKGFDATTTRDIAKEADTNVALINYYFRSKEKLFQDIFEDVAKDFFSSLVEVFNQDIPLKQKLELLIDRDVEFLLQNPEIPNFMMNQLRIQGQEFFQKFLRKEQIMGSLMMKQMEIAIANNEMRDLKFYECFLLIISNIQFLFISKPIMSHLGDLDEAGFQELVLVHKERVKEIVLGYIFLK